VIVTFVEGFSNDDLTRCFSENARLFERGEVFATVRDLRNVYRMPSAVQREMARRWQERVRDEFPRLCLGVAIVSDSSFIRGLVTAVGWATPPPIPEETHATLSQGVDWCLSRLDEHAVPISGELRRFAVEVTDMPRSSAPKGV
jgi:hypothetical protein